MTAQIAPVASRALEGEPDHTAGTLAAWLTGDQPASGLAVVGGAPGPGRTRLFQQISRLTSDGERLAGIVPDDGARRTDAQLLRTAITALGATPAGRTGLELTNELRAILGARREDALPPALLIDNATLTGSQLEILHNVLAARTDEPAPTVQIVLVGPPELPERIGRRRALAGFVRMVTPFPALDADGTNGGPDPTLPGDAAVQTRLALPGLDDTPAPARRRRT